MKITRRNLLQTGFWGSAAIASTVLRSEGVIADRRKFKSTQSTESQTTSQNEGYIDAHVHVWTPDIKRYQLGHGYRKDQMQPPSFTPKELLAHAKPCGVSRIVLIQMSFYRFDNLYMMSSP